MNALAMYARRAQRFFDNNDMENEYMNLKKIMNIIDLMDRYHLPYTKEQLVLTLTFCARICSDCHRRVQSGSGCALWHVAFNAQSHLLLCRPIEATIVNRRHYDFTENADKSGRGQIENTGYSQAADAEKAAE
jgi:hypothetical protein